MAEIISSECGNIEMFNKHMLVSNNKKEYSLEGGNKFITNDLKLAQAWSI